MTRRYLPLLVMAALTAAAYWYYHHTENTLDEDRWLGVIIVAGWVLSIVGMLVETYRWTFRNAALLFTVVGLVAFFGRIVLGLWELSAPDGMDVLYRACFAASAPVLLIDRLAWLGGLVRRPWRRRRSSGRRWSWRTRIAVWVACLAAGLAAGWWLL